jgi:SAM-dependent methyltransferase
MDDYTGTENLEAMAEAVNYNRFLLELVFKHASRDALMLDFGAGVGTFAEPLNREGFRVACVEPDRLQAERLVRKGLTTYRSIDDVPDRSVDVIYTLNVLEHIDDDRMALQALRRSIRKGGRLLVYVPAFEVLFTDMDRRVGHVRRYTKRELRDKVAAAGFDVVSVGYVDCIGFLATLYYKAFDRSRGQINRRALHIYDRFVFPVSRIFDTVGLGHFVGKNVLLVARA